MNILETKSLSKYYGKARGIVDVNLQVKEGEIFGFIGPNGAGKSTTIRTILNFIYPTSGEAKVFGMDCIKDSKEIRKNIGYLPSEVNYYDDMKVKELLDYSASFYKGDYKKRIKDLSGKLELDLNRYIDDLSYGNKKKVSIIQALLHSPKLLILDEPTGGLDPLMQNRFFEILREENEKGATIFFSSHILGEVQKMCDKVAIIKEGKILKVENIEDLRNNRFKNVKIELNGNKDMDFNIKGVINKEISKRNVKFLYNGKTEDLLKSLLENKVHDVTIEEPSLEEIFMHYYTEEVN
ncbi:ABC transporter ATP-binding protein [Sporosalibacterium faouarense]|uniref:ABC transporter ATP-binding protein n=1 Tax=Sporosalibacterium faouarense TaxID=516123 RepID=UPI00141CE2FA|nr:ABC transporter ATP-binding protein [Sporosalibacterium faouarense]MTI47521.1 ABC transporter ATP-binding protein [Bacillota bacterium]